MPASTSSTAPGADEQRPASAAISSRVEVGRAEPVEQRAGRPVRRARGRDATSGVSLPSRRSSPTGLPVTSASPNTPSRSSRSWNASPSGSPIAVSGARSSASRPASAAPRCSGRSTVYLPDLYRSMRARRSGSRCSRSRSPTRSRYWPTQSSMRSSSKTCGRVGRRAAHEHVGVHEREVADEDRHALAEPARLAAPAARRRAGRRSAGGRRRGRGACRSRP